MRLSLKKGARAVGVQSGVQEIRGICPVLADVGFHDLGP
jgi:hypothetical protein